MSFKVIRDAQNNVLCFGENTTNYAPVVPAGYTLTVESTAPFPKLPEIAMAIAKTYSDVDRMYQLAIGNRGEEYKQAEIDARAYAAGGYAGTPTAYISGWATVKGLTNQQAADAIIARADALIAAKISLRNQRFTSQAAIQAATTKAALDAALATWDAYIATISITLA